MNYCISNLLSKTSIFYHHVVPQNESNDFIIADRVAAFVSTSELTGVMTSLLLHFTGQEPN